MKSHCHTGMKLAPVEVFTWKQPLICLHARVKEASAEERVQKSVTEQIGSILYASTVSISYMKLARKFSSWDERLLAG